MINQQTAAQQPIILCHAACTGGSLIYRLLVSAFGFVGISEISHARRPDPKEYLPLDPEAQLLSQGIISPAEFDIIFIQRIYNCDQIVRERGKTLLVREHSHRYFFDPQQDDIAVDSVSWINDAYRKERGESLCCLVSVRNPIDSWLGLRNSFPDESPLTFDQYCEKYLNFIDRIEQTERVHLFKYEAFVHDPRATLEEIGKRIGHTCSNFDLGKSAHVASSGNSGRQGAEITARPRRPFTMHLVRSAEASGHYRKLCDRLGYPCLNDELGFQQRRGIVKSHVHNLLHTCADNLRQPFNRLAFKFPLIRD